MSIIDRLKVKKFRGATQPLDIAFSPDRRIAFIFGESGCGKTCIVDAIEFALTGRWGSLSEKKGLGTDTAKAKYLHSVGSGSSDLLVEVSSGINVWTGRMSRTTPTLSGPDGRPQIAVLRRAKLLSFVEAQPAERYGKLSAFIDVPNCIASEDGLGGAVKKVRADQVEKTTAIERDETALEGHWVSEGAPTEKWQKWAEDLSGQDLEKTEAEIRCLDGLITKIERPPVTESELQETMRNLDGARKKLSDAKETLVASESAGTNGLLVSILTNAKDFLLQHPDYPKCPVCEKQNSVDTLIVSIKERLVVLKKIQDAKISFDKAEKEYKTQEDLLFRNQSTFLKGVRTLLDEIHKAQTISPFVADMNFPGDEEVTSADENMALTAAILVLQDISGKISEFREHRNSLQKTVGKSDIVRRLFNLVKQTRKEATQLSEVQRRLETALKIVENCRVTYVNNVLLSVADDAKRMYTQIHPDEELGGFKLWLEKRSSLMLAGRFGSLDDVDPQAYYSESHLDTLGLCVFVALEKRGDAKTKLLILDDLLTSIDQPHLERTMEMLQDEAPNFGQVIITTHYGRFFEDFKRRHSSGSGVQFFRLKRWSLDTGIRQDTALLPTDELCAEINNSSFDAQAIASKAGVLLESLLRYITKKIQCPLPDKDDQFELGELLPAVLGIGTRLKSGVKTKKEQDIPDSWFELYPLIQKINDWANVRNLAGAHFNLEGANLSENEVKEFGNMVLGLHEKLVCPHCHEMVTKNTGSYWICRCRLFCLMPLRYKTS